MGRHLGSDFCEFLVDLGRQVGVENGLKIGQGRQRKSDEKKKSTRMAKKSNQGALKPRGRRKLGCGKGVGGRVNLSPKEGKVVCSRSS